MCLLQEGVWEIKKRGKRWMNPFSFFFSLFPLFLGVRHDGVPPKIATEGQLAQRFLVQRMN